MMLRSTFVFIIFVTCSHVSARFNLWYAVDTQSVVCPVLPMPAELPVGLTQEDWPTRQEYAMTIDYSSGMEQDQPHIVTLLRPRGSQEVTVEFQIVDASGDEVIPNTQVTLPAVGATPAGNCACTGDNTGINASIYGAEYGTACETWDNDNCAFLYPDVDVGPFCCKPWCYVDATQCEDAWVSVLAPGLSFSYAGACSASQAATPCTWQVPDTCGCINIDAAPEWSALNISEFGAGYGSSCGNWDYTSCSERYPLDAIDSWCCASWCWVSSSCPSGIASNVWPGLFWSDAKCPDNAAFVNQCPYKSSDGINILEITGNASLTDPACKCLASSPAALQSSRRRAGQAFPTVYGEYCAAWDADYCSQYFPREIADIWCCQTWCYVDEECPSANPSLVLPGWFWSYETCKEDGLVLANCNYSSACRPSGSNTGLDSNDLIMFGANYGTSCSAWDSSRCEEWYQESEHWQVGNNHWCCDSWTYVNASCPLAEKSWEALGLYFSYDICQDNASSSWYDDSTASCIAPPIVGGRLLSARRRSASYSGAPRRRTPRRRVVNPRRRSVLTPRRRAAILPRRRASYSTPRRRVPPRRRQAPPRRRSPTARRRTPTRVSALFRRRAPPVPRRRAPVSDATRRRAPPRRRSAPRRRAAPAPPRRRASPPRRRQLLNQPRRRNDPRRRSPPRRRFLRPRRRQTDGRRRGLLPRRRSPPVPPRRRSLAPTPRRRQQPNASSPPRRRTPRRRNPPRRRAPTIASTPRRRSLPRRRAAIAASIPRRRSSASTNVASSPRRRLFQTPRRRTIAPRRRVVATATNPRRRRSTPRRRAATLPRRRRARRRSAPLNDRRRAPTDTRRRSGISGGSWTFTPRRRASSTLSQPSAPSLPSPPTPRRRSPPRRRALTIRRRQSAQAQAPRRRRATSIPRRRVAFDYQGRQTLQQNFGGTVPEKTSAGLSGNGPDQGSSIQVVMAGSGGLASDAPIGVGSYQRFKKASDASSPRRRARRVQSNLASDWEMLTSACGDAGPISGNVPVSTAAECADNCMSVSECTGFDTDGRFCYLKSHCEGTVGTCVGTCGYRKVSYHRRRATHRRRVSSPAPTRAQESSGTFLDASWCKVPSGAAQGQILACADCYQVFGSACVSENSCFKPAGCFYELNQNTERDDIMIAGFMPESFLPPLTVTITKINGSDFNQSAVCPMVQPNTSTFDTAFVKASSVDVGMFLTLTQVEQIVETVNFQLEISNINLAQLNADATGKGQFIESIKEGIVKSAFTDVQTDDINVELVEGRRLGGQGARRLAGGVVAAISILPGGDDSAADIGADMSSSISTIAANIKTEVQEGVTSLASFSVGEMTVKVGAIDAPSAPSSTPSPSPSPSPAAEGIIDFAIRCSEPPSLLTTFLVLLVSLEAALAAII